jgi:hypothetical protein
MLLLAFVGCAQPAPLQDQSWEPAFEEPGGLDVGSSLAVYPGALDLKNRYLSNVIINSDSAGVPSACSGVLITSSKVLTAAHCVCAKRAITSSDRVKAEDQLNQAASSNTKADPAKKPWTQWRSNILRNARTVTDSSSCLVLPLVLVINYLGPPAKFDPAKYQASAVHPHPRFLSLDDDKGQGLFREADLAIIHLQYPVRESFRAIKLPSAEVRLKEYIVMVGYGLGETGYPEIAFGFRHFGESQVTRIDRLASGSTRFSALEQPADGGVPSRIQLGDSGGGGFSKADDTVLLGIVSSSSGGHGSIFESVYPHRKWLEAEINEGQ